MCKAGLIQNTGDKSLVFDNNIIMVYTSKVAEENFNDFLNFNYMDAQEVFFSVFH